MSKHKHAHSDYQPVRSFSHQLEGIPLFDQQAPSAPGSSSSEDAADAMTYTRTMSEEERVLTWFAAQSEPRTRHDCAAVLYPESGTGPACARINALVTLSQMEEVGREGKRATLRVTAAGFRRLANRRAA